MTRNSDMLNLRLYEDLSRMHDFLPPVHRNHVPWHHAISRPCSCCVRWWRKCDWSGGPGERCVSSLTCIRSVHLSLHCRSFVRMAQWLSNRWTAAAVHGERLHYVCCRRLAGGTLSKLITGDVDRCAAGTSHLPPSE